ncbi:19063_t:CDS:2 [Racocetra persica]|uniref:19063_t:CDS:1 n=1 Tax=Racocetra persica TaxID=160502 RepID=A0ACA9NVC3_9GLOM|nr:19063_t:CDS:2 [Racocetra persica]
MKQIKDMNEVIEDNKQSVSTGNNKLPQTSNEENDNLPLSSNWLARKIKCTSEISNDEIIKRLSNRSNNANTKDQCNYRWYY